MQSMLADVTMFDSNTPILTLVQRTTFCNVNCGGLQRLELPVSPEHFGIIRYVGNGMTHISASISLHDSNTIPNAISMFSVRN